MSEIATLTEAIKEDFFSYYPSVTKIEDKNGNVLSGFIFDFCDSDELAEKGMCRFVTMSNALAFHNESMKTGRANRDYSVIVELTHAKYIKLYLRGKIIKEAYLN